MIRALGLPHFGQTSRCGAGTFGVLLRLGRRSAWMESDCIGVSPMISNHGTVCRGICTRPDLGCWSSPAVQASKRPAGLVRVRRTRHACGSRTQQKRSSGLLIAKGSARENIYGNCRWPGHHLVHCGPDRNRGDCVDRGKSLKGRFLQDLLRRRCPAPAARRQ
jgi:hypothetical protein